MINYFQEAERILSNRGPLEGALLNLERRRQRVINASAPSGYPSIDFTQPYTSTSRAGDALSECLELAEIMREIATTQEVIDEIDSIIGQLSTEDAELLRAWYIKRLSKEDIAESLNYASATTIYDLRNKAVSRFAILYFGGGALAST